MAYAALASLARAIDQILPCDSNYAFLCGKAEMKSLYEQVVLLQELLDYISIQSFSLTIDELTERQIRDVAYKLEDIIESVICRSLGQEIKGGVQLRKSSIFCCISFFLEWKSISFQKKKVKGIFCSCIVKVDVLLREATKMKKVLEIQENIPRALASLARAIDQIVSQGEDYAFLCSQEQMKSLHDTVDLLQKSLENISGKYHASTIDVPKSRIADVIYKLDDIMESIRCKSLDHELEIYFDNQDFCRCFEDVNVLSVEAMEMKENLENIDTSRDALTRSLSTEAASVRDANVGIKADLDRILGQITADESNLQIIPITGMGGIGKTTFARAVYENTTTVSRFDVRVWVTVSSEFCIEDIFRRILLAGQQTEVSTKNLSDSVFRLLLGRRYLIVLDDMWHKEVWEGIRRALPKDNNGSCVILTTRLLEVAKYVGNSSNVFEMQLLNAEDSWALLREKVYGQEPLIGFETIGEDIGRAISNNCKGLPLAIVVVAGMLKFKKTKEYWNEIARNTKEKAASDSEHFLEILSLSYTNLPSHLKACFLYMGAFKEDYEIPTKEIAMIWTAEGFLQKPKDNKRMEEIAEECLVELVERSLVLVIEKDYNGKIKTSSVHDLLRQVSLRKSQEENFLHYFTNDGNMNEFSFGNIIKVQRRVSFPTHKLFEFPLDSYDSSARSILNIVYPMNPQRLPIIHQFQLLRLLYKVLIENASNLSFLFEMTNLRYLHFVRKDTYFPLVVPDSISNLQNLETLIFSGRLHAGKDRYELVLPLAIWKMPRLRHIVLMHKSNLLYPRVSGTCPVFKSLVGFITTSTESQSESLLENLQTLSWVTNFDFSKEAVGKIPNIKKLGVAYRIVEKNDSQQFHLDNLIDLHKLEELAVWCDYAGPGETIFAFPENLKKLSLERTRIPWKDMSIVGTLPHLEKLKLKWLSVTGKEWEPNVGEFLSLKSLKMDNLVIQNWRADSRHFPLLETLVIVSCGNLKEVPSDIGESDTMKKLIVEDCKYIVESVDKILEDQEAYDNTMLQVDVSDYDEFIQEFFPQF